VSQVTHASWASTYNLMGYAVELSHQKTLSAKPHGQFFDGCGATMMHRWPKDSEQEVHDISHLVKLLCEKDVTIGKHGHRQHPNSD